MKTTEEVLVIARRWMAARASATTLGRLDESGLTDLQKMKHAWDYATNQKKQPAALVLWLTEAIEREESTA